MEVFLCLFHEDRAQPIDVKLSFVGSLFTQTKLFLELFFALCTINRNKKDTTAFVFVLLFLTLGVKFIHSTKLIYNLLQYFKGYASLEF